MTGDGFYLHSLSAAGTLLHRYADLSWRDGPVYVWRPDGMCWGPYHVDDPQFDHRIDWLDGGGDAWVVEPYPPLICDLECHPGGDYEAFETAVMRATL